MRHNGLAAIPLTSIDIDTPLRELREACRQLGSTILAPDGVVCSALSSTFAVVSGFEAAGLRIGKDIDVVTKHSTELQRMLRPEVITIPEDFHAAGYDTARMVMDWLAVRPGQSRTTGNTGRRIKEPQGHRCPAGFRNRKLLFDYQTLSCMVLA